MATRRFIPKIEEADYEAFRRILGHHLPNTYEGFIALALRDSESDRIYYARQNTPVEMNADEFARYLKTEGADPNLQSLRNFAYEKQMGNQY
jgi:hypothetical protein